jgi:hypothetical protein
VRGLRRHRQRESAGGAPRDDGDVPAAVSPDTLEGKREVALPRCLHHVPAADGDGTPDTLLIAREDDADRRVIEGACFRQGAQSLEQDDVAALHVVHALAANAFAPSFPELRRALLLEDRIHVAEKQHAPSLRAFALGDEVPRTLHFRRHLGPACLETQGLELGGESLSDVANAFRVESSAVGAHYALQERHRVGGALLDGRDDALLGLRELREGVAAESEEEGG